MSGVISFTAQTYPGGYTNTPITDFYVSGTNYIDTNVENGITYYYTIKAVDSNNNMSDPSAEISVTPNPIIPDDKPERWSNFQKSGNRKSPVKPNQTQQVIINGELIPINADGSFTRTMVAQNLVQTKSKFCSLTQSATKPALFTT